MAYSYLQAFLDARLFTIAEENSNYQLLTATIPLFQKAIGKNKSKIISATLVALDQHTPVDDPVYVEVEELLKKKWPLVRNRYTDRPTTLLRAIIIESLSELIQENKVVANIIWLTGSNLFPFVTSSNETPILQQWLREAGDIAESNAVEAWGLTSQVNSITIPDFTLGKITLSNVTFDKVGLSEGLNEAVMNGNPIGYYTNTYGNSPMNPNEEWVKEFSNKGSDILLAVFTKGFSSLSTSLNALNLDKPINDFFYQFKEELVKTITASLKSNERLQLRSQILWWKEALYSASCQQSYRDMEAAQVSLRMAIDLAKDIPPIYPVSIDYILKETVMSCLETDKADKTVGELVAQLSSLPNPTSASWEVPESGRMSVGAFIAGLSTHKTNISELADRTGIPPEFPISYRDLATLLFHDIQARQINLKL